LAQIALEHGDAVRVLRAAAIELGAAQAAHLLAVHLRRTLLDLAPIRGVGEVHLERGLALLGRQLLLLSGAPGAAAENEER